jgi:SagB-type dehydrogenase family enzyme
MSLPPNILDRVERVYAHHRGTRLVYSGRPLTAESVHAPPPRARFPQQAVTRLPTTLLDAPLGVLSVLESSLESLPDSFISPPQTLKTLASWLFLADGVIRRERGDRRSVERRTCDGTAGLYPFEIYIAAFAIQDLEPGLYHYDARTFSLSRLRDGAETLALLKRGRPDLEFVKRAPAAILVSSQYSRASWEHGDRGYRAALVDTGQVVQNLMTTAGGLGIQALARLRMTDSTMRELIGLAAQAEYDDEESVQAMVVWADRTQVEASVSSMRVREPAASKWRAESAQPAPGINVGAAAVASLTVTDLMLPSLNREMMPPLLRAPVQQKVVERPSILSVHRDCVAPGVAVREIRPPLTELSPMPDGFQAARMTAKVPHDKGVPLRSVLLEMAGPQHFDREPISRDIFRSINQLAFRGGTFFPLFPEGVHAALIRPFWVIHHVSGMDSGIWFYRADNDGWCLLRPADFHLETMYLAAENELFGSASAVCFMVANLHALMTQAGPDTYRLAHLEAGTISQRLSLAARGFKLGSKATVRFFDDELKLFLGLEKTGWEPLAAVALGVPTLTSP